MTGGTPLEMIESVAYGEILLPNLISLSFVNTASFLYLNLWMNEMTLKQKMADFLKK